MELSKGFHTAEPGQLLEFIIVDKESRTAIFSPTEIEMEAECLRHGLEWSRIRDLIDRADKKVHSILIDVPRYRASLEEMESGAERAPESSP